MRGVAAVVRGPEEGDAVLGREVIVHRLQRALRAFAGGDLADHAPGLRIHVDPVQLLGGDADRLSVVVECAAVPLAVPGVLVDGGRHLSGV